MDRGSLARTGRNRVGLLSVLIAGCVAAPATDRDGAGLVGAADPSYPEVGVIVTTVERGGQRLTKTCTATLVTERVVVTARHCVPETADPCDVLFATSPDGTFDLASLGADASGTARGQELVRPAGVGSERMSAGIGKGMLRGDVLAIVLDRPMPLPPRGMRRGPALGPADGGAALRLVGAGKSPAELSTGRVTRSAVEPVVTVTDGLVATAPSTGGSAVRPGDSGGPVLLETGRGDKLLVGVITAQFPAYSLHTLLDPWSDVLRTATDHAATQAPAVCTRGWTRLPASGPGGGGGFGPASDEAPEATLGCGCDPGCSERGDCCDGCWSCACGPECNGDDVPCCTEGCE